jgi:hypothetical protein
MKRRPIKETPIERIYREVMGHRMSPALKRILLRRPATKRKAA